MADFFQEMIGSIDSLSEEQLQELLSILNAKQSTKKLKAVSNNDYQGTIKCEYCGSENLKKHGLRGSKQRYYCKDCKRTFVIKSAPIIQSSKITEAQWKELLRGMIQNLKLREIAENVDISITSVWYNKHKVCSALLEIYKEQDGFVDIAECDEYYTPLSFKGKRDPEFFIKTLGRMPRHHRNYAEKMMYLQNSGCWNELKNDPERIQQLIDSVETKLRGISKEQTCILTCKDRGNNLYMSPACIGRMDVNDVKKHLKGKFAGDSILVTDSHTSYPEFARSEHIQLEQIPSGKHAKGAYNLGRINALHSRLQNHWPDKSNRLLATKYLDLGLIFFWWLEKNSNLTIQEKVEKLYSEVASVISNTEYKDIPNRELSLNTKGLIPKKV